MWCGKLAFQQRKASNLALAPFLPSKERSRCGLPENCLRCSYFASSPFSWAEYFSWAALLMPLPKHQCYTMGTSDSSWTSLYVQKAGIAKTVNIVVWASHYSIQKGSSAHIGEVNISWKKGGGGGWQCDTDTKPPLLLPAPHNSLFQKCAVPHAPEIISLRADMFICMGFTPFRVAIWELGVARGVWCLQIL